MSRFDTQWKDRVAPAAQRAFGRTVSLERGGVTLVASFTARRWPREFPVYGEEGMPTVMAVTEYKFGSDELGGVTPQVGDRITDNGEVFELMPAQSLPAHEYRPDLDEHLCRAKKVSS